MRTQEWISLLLNRADETAEAFQSTHRKSLLTNRKNVKLHLLCAVGAATTHGLQIYNEYIERYCVHMYFCTTRELGRYCRRFYHAKRRAEDPSKIRSLDDFILDEDGEKKIKCVNERSTSH